jgi:hypothetical protein
VLRCNIRSPTPEHLGRQLESDCSSKSGCTVLHSDPNSFGANFGRNGGGVWATQFDVSGILYVLLPFPRSSRLMEHTRSIWFFPRSDIPSNIHDHPLDISSWGPPTAAYPSSPSCELSRFFSEQRLIIDITLCGVWCALLDLCEAEC